MNPQKALGAELMAALGIATVGAGKFPPPHRYTGIILLFFVLGIISQLGPGAARVAAALGGLVTLTILMGQAGRRVLGFFGDAGPRLSSTQEAT